MSTITITNPHQFSGQGTLLIDRRSGRIIQCHIPTLNAPPNLDPLLAGILFPEVAARAARICGVCSVSHRIASIEATEHAFAVPVSRRTAQIRTLFLDTERLESHVLHVGMLLAPEFSGQKSILSCSCAESILVPVILRLTKFAQAVRSVLGGPDALVPGGVSATPDRDRLIAIHDVIDATRKDVRTFVDAMASIPLPSFQHTDASGPPITGALARFAFRGRDLHPTAQDAARVLGLAPRLRNPFHNITAQVVEIVEAVENLASFAEDATTGQIIPECLDVRPRAGNGVGRVEAPRGTLVHEYVYDGDGRLRTARCDTPSVRNRSALERDLQCALPSVLADGDETWAALALETIVRAYDPCVSSAAPLLSVTFQDGPLGGFK